MKNEFLGPLKKVFGTRFGPFLALAVIAGVALMLLPVGSGGEETAAVGEGAPSSTEFCSLLEEKAVSLISELRGVSDCRVAITLERGFRYVYATDQHVREEENGKQTDKTVVLADTSGGESPILIDETQPTVSGVAVVCSGGDFNTELAIIELLSALFDVPTNRISVQIIK